MSDVIGRTTIIVGASRGLGLGIATAADSSARPGAPSFVGEGTYGRPS
jgi:hypothetical protein